MSMDLGSDSECEDVDGDMVLVTFAKRKITQIREYLNKIGKRPPRGIKNFGDLLNLKDQERYSHLINAVKFTDDQINALTDFTIKQFAKAFQSNAPSKQADYIEAVRFYVIKMYMTKNDSVA